MFDYKKKFNLKSYISDTLKNLNLILEKSLRKKSRSKTIQNLSQFKDLIFLPKNLDPSGE